MKFNQWTLGLAALGVVSLASAAKAEEQMTKVQSALSSTTISGYVDTSAQWNFGGQAGGVLPPYTFGGGAKADGFNLNVVQLTIAKPLDEGEWASGYRADLWFGPDATTLGSQFSGTGDLAIRQAYVALRAPIGNGLDLKMGVFDTVVGYETLEAGANPNMTRSYGFSLEPTTHTGLLASYKVNDMITVSGGVADTFGPGVNARATGTNAKVENSKTWLASIALTAPSDWGWASGSTLYFGLIHGFNAGRLAGAGDETHYYMGSTLSTPVKGLKVGLAFDYANNYNVAPAAINNAWVIGAYASYQATEKLSFHGRFEYGSVDDGRAFFAPFVASKLTGYEFTGTVQYDLWANVLSRLEIRWDRPDDISPFGRTPGAENSVMAAANIIYKF